MKPVEFTGTPEKNDQRVHLVDLAGYKKNVKLTVQALDPSGKAVFTWKGEKKLVLPHPAKLALAFPIDFVVNDDHTYYFVQVGDLDNDGRPDYLISRGTVQQEAHDADGRLLWKYDDPKASLKDVRADSDVRIYDIDNDGKGEAILARRVDGVVCLCIVDGKTGEIKRKIPYPGIDKRKDRSSINIANVTGKARASEILVSWDYSYIGAFDAQLNLIWESDQCLGHTPKPADIDGDGKDEVMCSGNLLDHNGKLIWSRTDLPLIRSVSMGSVQTGPCRFATDRRDRRQSRRRPRDIPQHRRVAAGQERQGQVGPWRHDLPRPTRGCGPSSARQGRHAYRARGLARPGDV